MCAILSCSIKSTDVLVGDIVHITAGDILTCDGIVLNMQKELKVDESDATGESDAISKTSLDSGDANKSSSDSQEEGQENGESSSHKKGKNDSSDDNDKSDPILLSGSKVLEGEGHFLVVAVGQSSFQGKIFMSLRSSQPDQTRMQKQLAALAEQIAKLASIAGGLLLFCLFLRNFVELKTKPDRTPAEKGQGFIQSFVIAVTLVVVAVPEGMSTYYITRVRLKRSGRSAAGCHTGFGFCDQSNDSAQPSRSRVRGMRDYVECKRGGDGQDWDA